ncbi:hypothetical protein ACMFMG_012060 [Clarireedia jacksonii]
MYESFFSYPVGRQYPYRSFTPTVIVGAIILAVLISFDNVIASGCELAATSTNNPNETIAHPRWYGGINWPSIFTDKVQATCAASIFNLNSQVFTNNSVFAYALQKIWRKKGNDAIVNLGSLVDCNVTSVNILIPSRDSRDNLPNARSNPGVILEAYAQCSIDIDTSLTDDMNGPTYFELVATFDAVNRDLYWRVFARNYKLAANGTVKDGLYHATIILTRNSTAKVGTAAELESLEFFHVECFTEHSYCNEKSVPQLMQIHKGSDPYPSIWKSVDVLGKAMWFSVLTDLGSNQSAVPNMLVEPRLLANLTSNFTSEYNGSISSSINKGLAQAPFDPNETPLPNLNATQATLITNYVCQVPRMKSAGRIFSTILQANLVYLQNAYALFVLIVSYLLYQRNPDVNYCDDCRGVVSHRAQRSNDQYFLLTGQVGAKLDNQDSSSSMHNHNDNNNNNNKPEKIRHGQWMGIRYAVRFTHLVPIGYQSS